MVICEYKIVSRMMRDIFAMNHPEICIKVSIEAATNILAGPHIRAKTRKVNFPPASTFSKSDHENITTGTFESKRRTIERENLQRREKTRKMLVTGSVSYHAGEGVGTGHGWRACSTTTPPPVEGVPPSGARRSPLVTRRRPPARLQV